MFDNLNFEVPVNRRFFSGGGKVGVIEISPGVVFDIHKRTKDKWVGGFYQYDGEYFSIGFDIFGCSSGLNLDTKEEVIAYLTQQLEKAPQYANLKAARDALSRRIKPLNDKWFKYGKQVFKLAKS